MEKDVGLARMQESEDHLLMGTGLFGGWRYSEIR